MFRARPPRVPFSSCIPLIQCCLLLGSLWVLAPSVILAQTILIQVTASDSHAPMPGAFVTLLDREGRGIRSALTNEQGRFLFDLPRPGAYAVRAQMIGRETKESDLLLVEGTQRLVEELQLSVRAVPLRGITAEGSARCTVRPEEGRRTAVVWDEARKALEVAAWALEEELFRYRLDRRVREYEPEGRRILAERYEVRSGYFREPFVSRPAMDLADQGFVQIMDGDTLAFAPSAAVLLSDPFLDTHCFRLREGSRDNLIGLAFEPVARRRTPDIEGILWLDPTSSELRSVEFGYTGYHQDGWPENAGGVVAFERLPSGAWIVRRWHITMPIMGEVERRVLGATAFEMRRVGFQEEGGEVLQILDRSGEMVMAARRALLSGRVYDSVQGFPLANARVYLAGTPWEATTDEQGRFQIPDLPEGAYTVEVSHPRLDSLTMEVPVRQVELAVGGMTWAELAVSRYSWSEFVNEQGVQGQIRGPSGTGQPGVFVALLDPFGRESASALTEEEGDFLLLAPQPGRYRLRVEDVGRERWESDLFPLDSGRLLRSYLGYVEPEVDLSSSGPAAYGDRACRVNPVPTSLAGRALGEVKKALALEVWARERDRLEHELLLFDRERDARDLEVWEDTVRHVDGFVEPVFPTRAPELLAEEGYVPSLGDTAYAFAPIPEVLLAPSFLATHCFRVSEEGDSTNLLGLAFQPLPRDDDLTDVRGMFLLDRESGELRSLHYRYTDFPGPAPERRSQGQRTAETQGYSAELWATEPGGWMTYRRLPDGTWAVSEWGNRVPMVISVMDTAQADPSPNLGLFGISERGGLSLTIRQVEGDTLLLGAEARVTPAVFDSLWNLGSRVLHGPGAPFEVVGDNVARGPSRE
ncbi:carboxypeptidase regulatory-like domain-containing protein, partial [Gemmatimonadota bacterium]